MLGVNMREDVICADAAHELDLFLAGGRLLGDQVSVREIVSVGCLPVPT